MNTITVFAACMVIFILTASPLRAETIFLRNGSIIQGSIISDEADTLRIRDKKNKIHIVARAGIMRILYTDLYMGKVYIQKTDGKNIIAYMVDEDRDTYTFRMDLYKPEEFTLRRDQVMFMARGNPSGLEGEAGTDRVELKWFPPYNPVRHYLVYLKGPGDRDFRSAEKTGSKNITLKGLKSNTKYILRVTAIDRAGDESLPSNELSIETKNIRPEMPVNIKLKKIFASDKKTYDAEITWDAATDADGKVRAYAVYRHDMSMDSPATKVNSTSYRARDLTTGNDYFFTVKSIDDKNEESEAGAYVNTWERPFLYGELSLSSIFPVGKLGDLFDQGFGVDISAYKTDLLFKNMEAGLKTGFWMLFGSGDTADSSFMIPVMASLRYRFPVMVELSVVPEIDAGYRLNSMTYRRLNQATLQTEKVTEWALEPAVSCGFSMDYRFSRSIRAFLGTGYMMIIEKDGPIHMITATVGTALLFY